jgi:hypothetical protein
LPVKRAAGRFKSLPVLRSLKYVRCIPPALDHLKRRNSQGTHFTLKKMGVSDVMESNIFYAKPNRTLPIIGSQKPDSILKHLRALEWLLTVLKIDKK